jgi:hypothetical protein
MHRFLLPDIIITIPRFGKALRGRGKRYRMIRATLKTGNCLGIVLGPIMEMTAAEAQHWRGRQTLGNGYVVFV